jgi:hypothetical protein
MNSVSGRNEKLVRQDLDGRYGTVAMPALAAALRYPSDSKNPAYAPVDPRDSGREQDAA